MANKNMDMVNRKPATNILSWKAPDFVYYPKNFTWYLVVSVLAIGIGVAFYYMQNYLGMTMVILAGIILIILGNKKPKDRLYKIDKDNLYIDDKIYLLKDFKSYYVTYVGDYVNLHLEKNKKLSTPISTLLSNNDAETIINYIKKYFPENTKITNTASDLFSNWFKF